jgi:hypothetical protein
MIRVGVLPGLFRAGLTRQILRGSHEASFARVSRGEFRAGLTRRVSCGSHEASFARYY